MAAICVTMLICSVIIGAFIISAANIIKKNTLSKHGLMRGDKYAAEILQELATEFSKNIIVSSLYPPY